MKEDTTKDQRNRKLRWMAFCGVLLAAGCTCVTVQINWPSGPSSSPSAQSTAGPAHPAGGNFPPLAGSLSGQPSPVKSTICNIAIQTTYVDLNQPTPTRTPPTGTTGFRGYLTKSTGGGSPTTLPNSSFVLYWYVNSQIQGCCVNVPGDSTFVQFTPPSSSYPYRFKAYWVQGQPAPAPGDTVTLQATWLP